jgi:hypothetical protein
MKKLNFLLLSAVTLSLVSTVAIAQNDLPSNAVNGKCYAKCLKPAQFTTKTEQYVTKEAGKTLAVVPAAMGKETQSILVKEAAKRLEIIPATYKTVSEQVLVKEAGKIVTVVAAVYKTETESYLVKDASKRMEVIPAIYKTVTENIFLGGCPTGSFLAGTWDNTRKAFVGIDGSVVSGSPCKKQEVVPAVLKSETEQYISKAASKTYTVIPAVYKTETE